MRSLTLTDASPWPQRRYGGEQQTEERVQHAGGQGDARHVEHLGDAFVDAQLPPDSLRGGLSVPREHHDAYTGIRSAFNAADVATSVPVPMAMQTSIWIQMILGTPVVLWAGWPFFVSDLASVKNRSLNMFTLIALGTGAAWGIVDAVACHGQDPPFIAQVLRLRSNQMTYVEDVPAHLQHEDRKGEDHADP